MTYEQTQELITAENARMEQAILESAYQDGSTDAAAGIVPQYADQNYLRGYLDTLLLLPKDATGKVVYPSPQSNFSLGWVDTPDPVYYDCPF